MAGIQNIASVLARESGKAALGAMMGFMHPINANGFNYDRICEQVYDKLVTLAGICDQTFDTGDTSLMNNQPKTTISCQGKSKYYVALIVCALPGCPLKPVINLIRQIRWFEKLNLETRISRLPPSPNPLPARAPLDS